MKRIPVALFVVCALLLKAAAQTPVEIDIWPNGLPNSNGRDLAESYDDKTHNYKPTLYVHLPDKNKATGCAILALPGGGYGAEALQNEGHAWASALNEHGIALIVVKYRLPFGHTSAIPETDVYEAIRITRRHAAEWNINPHKVGVMGFSAGGHLASTVATHAKGNAKPDFQILFYPVISMRPDMRTATSTTKPNLIGIDALPEIEKYYSNDEQVTSTTPPAMIITVNDDTLVPTRNSTAYYLALQKAGVAASLHIYPSGGHGFGASPKFPFRKNMLDTLLSWLDTR